MGASTDQGCGEIATVRIELLDTDPPIWRQVEVPTAITLKGLHDVVQAAMGWFNQHLWEFRIGRTYYGLPVPGGWNADATRDARKVALAELLKPRRTVIDYTYDMGDSWDHRLTVTDVRRAEPGAAYPRLVAGERPAPPEDCGGIPGFYAALEAAADPKHPEHEEVAEWLGDYDAERYNELALERAVGRIAVRRRAASAKKN